MNSVSNALVSNASTAPLGSVQGQASVSVLKSSEKAQAAGVAKLLDSVAQPALATSGSLGTQLNAVA
jgi:hypothetical protein